ncbi:MAG: VCBS repeat-containing protein [Thermoguttaceae bacterium]
MHVMGQWLNLTRGGNDTWKVTGPAPDMSGTFTGGTDMLLHMVQYIVRDADSDVPVTVGVKWGSHVKVGNVPGEIAGIAAVEVGKLGKAHLFVASAAGDKFFRPKGEDFEDATAASGLDTKSRRFTWLDVDGDGLADLVTWDGKTLSLRLAGKDGRFRAAEGYSLPLDGCLYLAPCSTDGRPGVLVSRRNAPLLLIAGVKGWKEVELPGAPEGVGQPSACIVADLDNDGFVDVLQPGEYGSTLWRGKAGGFERPVHVNIATGGGTALAAVGDFAQNGRLDIFLAGQQKNTLWESDGKGGFREVGRFGGSISYKCPPGASAVQVMDLNHDGRQDLCLAYEQNDLLYHFNRGFRSFAEEGELRLPGTQTNPSEPPLGQKAVACADFNADGSNDLAVLLTNGDLYCYFNDQAGVPGVRLRLPPGVTGPVTASCWTGEKFLTCAGTLPVPGHSPATYLSTRTAGECKIRYRLPGGPEVVKTVTVEDAPKDVVLDATGERK